MREVLKRVDEVPKSTSAEVTQKCILLSTRTRYVTLPRVSCFGNLISCGGSEEKRSAAYLLSTLQMVWYMD